MIQRFVDFDLVLQYLLLIWIESIFRNYFQGTLGTCCLVYTESYLCKCARANDLAYSVIVPDIGRIFKDEVVWLDEYVLDSSYYIVFIIIIMAIMRVCIVVCRVVPAIRLISIEQLLFIVIVEVVQARFWRTLGLYNVLRLSEDLLVKNDKQVFFIHWNYTGLGVNLLFLLPELLMEYFN